MSLSSPTEGHRAGEHVPVHELHQGSPIVVLAPHPDDESLGCGGLLAAAWQGPGAHVVCLSDGAGSHPHSTRWPPARLAERRAQELQDAVLALGGSEDDLTWLNCKDGWIPREGVMVDCLVARIAELCESLGCQRLFSTSDMDAHADHKSTALIAQRVSQMLSSVSVMHYPIWSRIDTPERLARISRRNRMFMFDTHPWQSVKRQAIQCHRTQLGLVVDDDLTGFVLPATMIELFSTEPELFIEVDNAIRIA